MPRLLGNPGLSTQPLSLQESCPAKLALKKKPLLSEETSHVEVRPCFFIYPMSFSNRSVPTPSTATFQVSSNQVIHIATSCGLPRPNHALTAHHVLADSLVQQLFSSIRFTFDPILFPPHQREGNKSLLLSSRQSVFPRQRWASNRGFRPHSSQPSTHQQPASFFQPHESKVHR